MLYSSTHGLPDPHLLHMGVFYAALLVLTWSSYVRLSESGHAAVVYTLVDSVTSELRKQAASVSHEPENSTGPVTIPLTLSDAPSNDTQYIVRAEPRQESAPPTQPAPATQEGEVEGVATVVGPDGAEEINDTLSAVPAQEPPPAHQEDIPSFSEWAQKQLAEAEKKKGENVTGGSVNNNSVLKVRHSKNYASPDCGAKVVGSNPEAVSAGAVLSSSRDEYLLNTCNARTWFIVELCEAIQPKKIEMANFELFSSSPKEFSVWLSDRYPTRDWALAGRFTAQDERNLQAFNLSDTAHFGKYVKVEVHSHYGKEHYCPVSLLRVYGTSEIEVLDTVDEGDAHHAHELGVDDDDDEVVVGEKGEEPRNLFGSARDAVLSIVKKAAEALAKTPDEAKLSNSTAVAPAASRVEEPCVTPSHIVVCVNCSDDFYNRVYELMSCRSQSLSQLLSSEFVKQTMSGSELCAERGLDLRVGAPYPPSPRSLHARPRPIHYLQALLPDETLAALCNQLAVAQKKVVLNISYERPADTDNQTVLPSTVVTEEPLVLPDTASCPVESNMSEEKLATRPPYEPAHTHATTLPIRPSRTVRVEELPVLSPTVAEEVEANATVEPARVEVEVAQPADNTSSNNSVNGNGSLNAPSTNASAENLTLAVEDVVSLDSLFSELEQAVVPSPRVPPAPQKESVFVRLANRIKALERNMSLSGQYLEELSRRYKRQVEEMQKALVGAGEERRRWEERDSLRLEQVSQLAQQVETLTHAVKGLLEERDSWQHKATVMTQHGLMVVVEVIVFTVVLYLCRWLPDMQVANRRISVAWRNSKSAPAQPRRKSVDQVVPPAPSKKRRPSEEALVIAGNTHQELLIPDARRKTSKGETRRQRRKRRRELAQGDREERPSLLDRNSTESVKPWWEEEVIVPTSSAPPPVPARAEVVTAPRFVQTAVAQRQDRIALSRSTSEASEKESKPFLKKTGPLKKIVKKFF